MEPLLTDDIDHGQWRERLAHRGQQLVGIHTDAAGQGRVDRDSQQADGPHGLHA